MSKEPKMLVRKVGSHYNFVFGDSFSMRDLKTILRVLPRQFHLAKRETRRKQLTQPVKEVDPASQPKENIQDTQEKKEAIVPSTEETPETQEGDGATETKPLQQVVTTPTILTPKNT